ncbi:hypothetical protein TTHERM_00256910 (macronuclear) [Tetrahymena thermophila SB210]|uniref:Uncharacterized protein n=1 Tax=Tetrahymena thermophila (strain SB210) TaxID=312017 RepID=Q23QI7_TETTS|nr:hypothetical protein TTHERM_00256910 [Tetrahymena thermophila SB210]EAR98901.3 hypothetical protein TTHERM_00256910 [Tetrahymena thermophila SB210]|eukprot:XP_001019146.3 hypothetical protein TTHERM_00256910 [Tetrahymena thermophila SB210]
MMKDIENSVSDEVIDDLKRMKRIVSSHVPNFAKSQFEIPESIQKIIEKSAKDQKILKKTASTHIRNSIQSSQYFGHALNSNHDMDIDMRRQRLSWLNREFPRQNKQNQNKKIFDSQTILQTLENLRHMNSIQYKQHFGRHTRSSSLNPTSKTNSNTIPSESESSNLNNIDQAIKNRKNKVQIKEFIKEEDIQEDSQGFILLQRQYKNSSQNESFEGQTDKLEIICQTNNKDSFQGDSTHKVKSHMILYDFNDIQKDIQTQKLKKVDQNQHKDRPNQENQKENEQILYKIDKTKQDDNKVVIKKGERSFSPIKPKSINFDMALELDKNNRLLQEQQSKQNQNQILQQQIQQRSSQVINQQNSQQSQRSRPRIFSEDKKSEWNEGSLMLPANALNSSSIEANSQFLLAKSLSNIQFSHLKQSRYIDYVNHVHSNYEFNSSSNNDATKESKQLLSSTMKNFNQNEEKQTSIPLDDICKKNNSQIYGSRMIRKEVDLQKILNARGLLNKQNSYQQQSEYFQSDKYLCQIPWQSQDVLEFEKKLNNREKAQINVYQHQFIKKYLNMKKDNYRKNITSNSNLSQISQNQNSQSSIINKNKNIKGSGYLSEISEVSQSLKRLNKNDKLNLTNQQELFVGTSSGNIQYEQIGQKGKFFANPIPAEIPKINESTQNIREVKSFKILKTIINRNLQSNQVPFLQNQSKYNEQIKKDKQNSQIIYRASDYLEQL